MAEARRKREVWAEWIRRSRARGQRERETGGIIMKHTWRSGAEMDTTPEVQSDNQDEPANVLVLRPEPISEPGPTQS